ncbi:hypothetical protein C4577_02065 [Candidatus Parcubacteria bacterium]|nr:MAG: hypothetical protein C4577_02065 [Candidatus Parcubacteria bacterium]
MGYARENFVPDFGNIDLAQEFTIVTKPVKSKTQGEFVYVLPDDPELIVCNLNGLSFTMRLNGPKKNPFYKEFHDK